MDSEKLFNLLKPLNKAFILAIYLCGFDTCEEFGSLATNEGKFQRAIKNIEKCINDLAKQWRMDCPMLPSFVNAIVPEALCSVQRIFKYPNFSGDKFQFDEPDVKRIKLVANGVMSKYQREARKLNNISNVISNFMTQHYADQYNSAKKIEVYYSPIDGKCVAFCPICFVEEILLDLNETNFLNHLSSCHPLPVSRSQHRTGTKKKKGNRKN